MDKVADPELIFFFQKHTSRTAKFNICHLVALGSNGSAYGTPTGFQLVISNWGQNSSLEATVSNIWLILTYKTYNLIEFEQKVRVFNGKNLIRKIEIYDNFFANFEKCEKL